MNVYERHLAGKFDSLIAACPALQECPVVLRGVETCATQNQNGMIELRITYVPRDPIHKPRYVARYFLYTEVDNPDYCRRVILGMLKDLNRWILKESQ